MSYQVEWDIFEHCTLSGLRNTQADSKADYPKHLEQILSRQAFDAAQQSIKTWQGYKPTPLFKLEGFAQACQVGAVYYKDEHSRFALKSFKALGGAYAVLQLIRQLLSKKLNHDIQAKDILAGQYKNDTRDIHVVTPTDGNHGRSVAWGAKLFGCACSIYMHKNVSSGRAQAVEALGAQVIRVEGDYDDSVRVCLKEAKQNAGYVVSDTSWEGYTHIPTDVMAGYSVLMAEIFDLWNSAPLPTHVLIQAGVGGLAASVTAFLWQKYGKDCPKIIVVEPDLAPCIYNSMMVGVNQYSPIQSETIMAGLSCGEPSLLAWPILKEGVNDFVLIADDIIAPTMKLLAYGCFGDDVIYGGESGVAGLAALMAISRHPRLAEQLQLTPQSKVLLIGTEGVTDQDIYRTVVGFVP